MEHSTMAVGRPGKIRLERPDGSMRVFTREKLILHLTEAIEQMAAKGKKAYDAEVEKACKTQGDEERVHEAVTLHGKNISDLLSMMQGKGLFETSNKS